MVILALYIDITIQLYNANNSFWCLVIAAKSTPIPSSVCFQRKIGAVLDRENSLIVTVQGHSLKHLFVVSFKNTQKNAKAFDSNFLFHFVSFLYTVYP